MSDRERRRYRGRATGSDDPPQPLSSALEGVLRAQGLTGAAGLAEICDRWAEIVGESLASHSRPIRIENATLLVRADQSVWATQLRMLSARILERIRPFVPSPVLERLYVSVGHLSD